MYSFFQVAIFQIKSRGFVTDPIGATNLTWLRTHPTLSSAASPHTNQVSLQQNLFVPQLILLHPDSPCSFSANSFLSFRFGSTQHFPTRTFLYPITSAPLCPVKTKPIFST